MTGRIAVIGAVTLVGLGGVAAAATGALPGSDGQEVVADTTVPGETTSSVDTTAPDTTAPDTTADTTAPDTTAPDTTAPEPAEPETTVPSDEEGARGPDATGPARWGLCQAFGDREAPGRSVAAGNLAAAAAAAGQSVEEFCAATPRPGDDTSTGEPTDDAGPATAREQVTPPGRSGGVPGNSGAASGRSGEAPAPPAGANGNGNGNGNGKAKG